MIGMCRGMGGRGAVLLAVAWWAGLVLGAGRPWGLGVGAAVIACALLLPRRSFLLPVVFLCAGVARMAVADAQLDATLARLPPLPMTTRLSGVVDEPPRREGDAPAAVVRILAASPAWPRDARVALRLPAGCMAEQGDTVEVLARLEAWPGLRVPGGYDAQRAARVGALLDRDAALPWRREGWPEAPLLVGPLSRPQVVERMLRLRQGQAA